MKKTLLLLATFTMLLIPANLLAAEMTPGPYSINNEVSVYNLMGLDLLDNLKTNLYIGEPPQDCQCCPETWQGLALTECVVTSQIYCIYSGNVGPVCYE